MARVELSELKLTDREIAIAEGRDPNEVVDTNVDGSNVDDVSPENEQVESEESTGQVAEDSTSENGGWIDDDVKSFASGYGLDADDLSRFDSREELETWGRIQDRLSARKTREQEDKGGKPVETKTGTETKPEANGGKPGESGDETEEELNLADYEEYDDATKKVVRSLKREQDRRRRLEETLKSIEPHLPVMNQIVEAQKRVQQEQASRQLAEFESALDGVGIEVLGKDHRSLSRVQEENRGKVWSAVQQIYQRQADEAIARGKEPPVPDIKQLASRAVTAVFGDTTGSSQSKRQNVSAIREQARKVRPAGGGRVATRVADTGNDDDVANHPEIVALHERLLKESGDR